MALSQIQLTIFLISLTLCGVLSASPISIGEVIHQLKTNGGRKDLKSNDKELNDRPIIAVLTQRHKPLQYNQSYLAASYVKYIESSGIFSDFQDIG